VCQKSTRARVSALYVETFWMSIMTVTPLFERLKAAVLEDWEAYIRHPFVQQLGAGTLPEEAFRHYLMQDYLFLIHFARAWALAAFKSHDLEDIRTAARTLHALVYDEMRLHIQYCARWGIEEEALQHLEEARATMAYTRFVLERGAASDLLELHVALAPCIVGYAEIGAWLQEEARMEGNPYREWIEMYSGEAYQQVAADAIEALDRLELRYAGPERFPELADTFRKATRLEIDFWEMGLTQSY